MSGQNKTTTKTNKQKKPSTVLYGCTFYHLTIDEATFHKYLNTFAHCTPAQGFIMVSEKQDHGGICSHTPGYHLQRCS